jgi:hypothetical protein
MASSPAQAKLGKHIDENESPTNLSACLATFSQGELKETQW